MGLLNTKEPSHWHGPLVAVLLNCALVSVKTKASTIVSMRRMYSLKFKKRKQKHIPLVSRKNIPISWMRLLKTLNPDYAIENFNCIND